MTITNEPRLVQPKDFRGLRWGALMPTDLDICYDHHGLCWVLGELKVRGTPLPEGQQLAYTRLCEDVTAGGREVLFLIAEHRTEPPRAIDVARCMVRKYWWGGSWHPLLDEQGETYRTVLDMFNHIIKRVERGLVK